VLLDVVANCLLGGQAALYRVFAVDLRIVGHAPRPFCAGGSASIPSLGHRCLRLSCVGDDPILRLRRPEGEDYSELNPNSAVPMVRTRSRLILEPSKDSAVRRIWRTCTGDIGSRSKTAFSSIAYTSARSSPGPPSCTAATLTGKDPLTRLWPRPAIKWTSCSIGVCGNETRPDMQKPRDGAPGPLQKGALRRALRTGKSLRGMSQGRRVWRSAAPSQPAVWFGQACQRGGIGGSLTTRPS
jgi:hypothetical protein